MPNLRRLTWPPPWGLTLSCIAWVSILGGGCSRSTNTTGLHCSSLTGSAWVPQVSGVAATNHDSSVTLSKTTIQTTGTVMGLGQAVPQSKEISVSIDMTQDLGAYGSLTLMAQTSSFPSTVQGNAFAYLVSLSDGTNEYINLSRSGTAGDCTLSGYYTCTSGSCSANSGCTIAAPSAFQDRDHWEQHQGYANSATNFPSINIFPTCNWAGGTLQSASTPACSFNSTFFPAAAPVRLRYGVTYTAKYVLLSDSYSTLGNVTSGLTVTVVKKTSNRASLGGAIDVNLVLVGNKNIQASRTVKGQQNLNTLATAVANYYGQSNVNIKIGTFRSIEWSCSKYGDQYANIGVSELATLFSSATTVLPTGLDTQALNVFLVSSITDDSAGADSNLTILGVDGAIGGPVMNGTSESGMVVSTFNTLDTLNPNCSTGAATCPLTQQEDSFFELGETIAHEMGHYFGLNHLSESDGTQHDYVLDTPICTAAESIGGSSYITGAACLNTDANVFSATAKTCTADCATVTATYSSTAGTYCPASTSCEFNYIMWWTTKNFTAGTGTSDGNLFSGNQGSIINYHPLVQ